MYVTGIFYCQIYPSLYSLTGNLSTEIWLSLVRQVSTRMASWEHWAYVGEGNKVKG
jgi:hypothetical protein